jgi:sulfur carrier protein ThiS
MNQLLAMLRRRLMALWIWQSLFIIAVVWGVWHGYETERIAMGRMRFVAMDSRDSFYLNNMGSFQQAQTIHVELAKMAAETIFNRSPNGYEAPERMERLFAPKMYESLHRDAARDEQVFQAQDIHQTIETGKIRELTVDNNTALVSVEGQVLSRKTFNQKIVNDARNVTLFLRLQVNPDMASNGRYPLVVTNYEYK